MQVERLRHEPDRIVQRELPYLEQPALARQYSWGDSWFDPPNQPVGDRVAGVLTADRVTGVGQFVGTVDLLAE
jgi:hypothetical protein